MLLYSQGNSRKGWKGDQSTVYRLPKGNYSKYVNEVGQKPIL